MAPPYNNDPPSDPADDEIVRREARLRNMSETLYRMNRACPTSLMQDIVNDLRSGPAQRSSIIPDNRSAPVERGSGGGDRPLTPPPGIEHVDAIADAFAERERRKAVLDAAMENEFILRQQQRLRDHELDPCNWGHYKSKDELDRGE